MGENLNINIRSRGGLLSVAAFGVVSVVGLGIGIGEWFGDGECAGYIKDSIMQSDTDDTFAEACSPGETKGKGYIERPEILEAFQPDLTVGMSFGHIAVVEMFPEGTKIDFDKSLFSGGVPWMTDFTRHVGQTPFQINVVPCTRVNSEPGSQAIDLPETSTTDPGGDVESVFDVVFEQDNPDNPLEITKIYAVSRGLEACHAYKPVRNANGDPNYIEFYNGDGAQGQLNTGVERTFEFAVEEIAVNYAVAADCISPLIDSEQAMTEVKKYLIGEIALSGGVDLSTFDLDNLVIVFDDQQGIIDEYQKRYEETVAFFQDLEKSMFDDNDGNRKDMTIEFSDDILEVQDCATVVDVAGSSTGETGQVVIPGGS